jgi:type IV pilus assembly protein PilW
MIPISSITSPESPRLSIRLPLTAGQRARGFSLVELMIAIVLGFLVVAGVINLFLANNKAFQQQSGNNYLQENLRIASDRISWSLRMSDFWGGATGGGSVQLSTTASGKVTANGNCNGSWATALNAAAGGGAVYGYSGAAAVPTALGATCIGGAANYVAGSDVLVVRYAYPQVLSPGPAVANVTPAESSTISGEPSQIFVLATSDGTAQLFPGSTVPPTTSDTFTRYAYPYQIDMFYLRPCSVPVTGTTCSAAADGGAPLPTLMRMHLLTTGVFESDPVIDGVEQLNFEYAVSTTLTDILPQYYTAAQVTANGTWANVVAVRVTVVAVNPARDMTIPHGSATPYTLGTLGTCTYTINNNAAATTTGCSSFTPYGNNPWQFVRKQQSFVVQLRNRIPA